MNFMVKAIGFRYFPLSQSNDVFIADFWLTHCPFQPVLPTICPQRIWFPGPFPLTAEPCLSQLSELHAARGRLQDGRLRALRPGGLDSGWINKNQGELR
jgi:hypothetical protein